MRQILTYVRDLERQTRKYSCLILNSCMRNCLETQRITVKTPNTVVYYFEELETSGYRKQTRNISHCTRILVRGILFRDLFKNVCV